MSLGCAGLARFGRGTGVITLPPLNGLVFSFDVWVRIKVGVVFWGERGEAEPREGLLREGVSEAMMMGV